MKNANSNLNNVFQDKRIIILIVIILCVIVALVFGVFKSVNEDDEKNDLTPINNEQNSNDQKDGFSLVLKEEKPVSLAKAKTIYNWLPKTYKEATAPFNDRFMLEIAMEKICQASNEEPDFSENNVNKFVKDIFGPDKSIIKENVNTQDINESLYYYDESIKSYAIIPVGLEGFYHMQILKEVTETDEAYYVYSYVLLGQYIYDNFNIGDMESIDYDSLPLTVIVGDKDGNDLIQKFNNSSEMYNENVWLENHKGLMQIYRYTLLKSEDEYYLSEVEGIGY